MQAKATLICDLDNTLYDWVAFFVPSFYAMVNVAVSLIGCDQPALLSELREVHQRHHNSEHPYALLETNIVRNWLSSGHDVGELEPAFRSFNSERKKRLLAYPTVHQTLNCLKDYGVRLIAHSDSNALGVIDRLMRLHLVDYFDFIYCVESPTTDHPRGGPYSSRFREFPFSKLRLLGGHEKKPNPEVLEHIIAENKLDKGRVAYIGDSLAKDIAMAANAQIYSVWAEYGASVDPGYYAQLVRVSHWTTYDIQHEKALREASLGVAPNFTCDRGFDQVVQPVLAMLGDSIYTPDRLSPKNFL
ncbi:HAD family hydrolase [Rhizobium indicum]|uniref:phosphoglycolate phosphatase n=1 Tax=Rhizobium indicum TaxID=2583231 RepID=A0ABX6PG36_9HYPH|nr:HAD family hydrolase [Rhizobium indicum]QKK16815.1 HAD family hydrolase [Rhizobium indicum]